MFLNKTTPTWAKCLFITANDLCTVIRPGFTTADEFIKSHTPRKHIRYPGYLDYLEILKLIPKDWQNKIKQNTALPEQDCFFHPKEYGKKRTLARHNAMIFAALNSKKR